MPMRFKIDILETLQNAGYNTNRIRKEKLIAEATLQNLRHNKPVSWATLETICALLNCQPGDLIEYAKEEVISE